MDDFSLNFARVGIELDILKLFYDNYLKNKKKFEVLSTSLSIIFKSKPRGITNPGHFLDSDDHLSALSEGVYAFLH